MRAEGRIVYNMDTKSLWYGVAIVVIAWLADFEGFQTYTRRFYKTVTVPPYEVFPDEIDKHTLNSEILLKKKRTCPIHYEKKPVYKRTFICYDEDDDRMIDSQDRCILCNSIYHAHEWD